MSEEEKNIEMFKRYINSLEQKLEDYYRIDEEFYKDNIEDLELNIKLARYVLNLINKQQSEIEAQNMIHKYDTDMIEEVKGEAVKLYNKIERLQKELDKKNKVIDLMSECIYDNDNFYKLKCAFEKIEKGKEPEYIKNNFCKKVEDKDE